MKRMRSWTGIIFAVIVGLGAVNFGRTASEAKAASAAAAARAAAPRSSPAASTANFVLVAHGGAGSYSGMTPEMIEARREAMVKAIRGGYGILAGGGSSLDAVEATIRVMEDSGLFDSGRGGYYTREGVPELDAAIMDGRTLAAGSVGSVKHIANPIHLARLVMEKTPHVMLVGVGAEEFAKSQGIELVSPYYFYNEREWQRFLKAQAAEKKVAAVRSEGDDEHGTVGVVALDQAGNLAAGTSTGGTVLKMPGRVGIRRLLGRGLMRTMRVARCLGQGWGNTSCATWWRLIFASGCGICM